MQLPIIASNEAVRCQKKTTNIVHKNADLIEVLK